MLICANTFAQTTNWYVDGTLYQTTSCTSGNDVTPPTAPTKRGYTFSGWLDADLIVGSWSRSGTPSPTNPVYPVFYQNGNLILRAVGTGSNLIADTYNTATGKITRRIRVKVFDGTETVPAHPATNGFYYVASDALPQSNGIGWCSHESVIKNPSTVGIRFGASNNKYIYFTQWQTAFGISTQKQFQDFLAEQYAAGTPVTIYYPLETPVEEYYTPAP